MTQAKSLSSISIAAALCACVTSAPGFAEPIFAERHGVLFQTERLEGFIHMLEMNVEGAEAVDFFC
jgi:hypothetical protein